MFGMKIPFVFAALFLGVAAAPVLACEKPGNVMQSPLALPADSALNAKSMGGVFVVAPDECAETLYRVVFPKQLEAAESGNVAAMDVVGLMYAAGAGTARDWKAAHAWLQRAAAAGSVSAQYRLGIMFQFGHGVDANLPRAIEQYRAASEKGLAWATTNIGVMALNGTGMPADPAEAARLFELARQQGDPEATANLAVIHARAMLGGEPDFVRAFGLAKEAAQGGSVPGMRLLGYSYANALGTQQDLETAYVWASLAAERGDGMAAQLMSKIAPSLPSDVRNSAQRRLKICTEKGPKLCV